jgi:PAS domain S-box-containing protein
MGRTKWLMKINPWHFLWISIVIVELFTLISNTAFSMIWWGSISSDRLLFGSIPALAVSLLVAAIVIFFLKKTSHLNVINEQLQVEIQRRQAVENTLEHSGQYFQTILDVFPDPLMVINRDYTIDFANAAAQQLAGRDPVLGGLTCYEASHHDTAPCDGMSHPCPIEMVRTAKKMVYVQHEHVDAHGDKRWIDISAAPIFDPDGEVLQIIEYGRDVTSQKRAESRLQESEERYRHILAVAPDVITITRLADGRYIEVNDYFCNLTGYSREETLGRTPFDLHLFVNPQDRQRLVDAVARDGEVQDLELQYRKKDGVVIDTLLSARRLNLAGEDCLVAVTRNITEHKEADRALRASEEKYRLLVEHQSDLVVKVDLEGRFLFASPSYCEIFGKTEKELLGHRFMPLVHEEDRESTAKAMEALFVPPHRAYMEQRALTKDGWRWLSWADTAVLNDEGQIEAIIGIGRDITERKKAEIALAESRTLFDAFMHHLPSLAFMKDAEGRYIYFNEAWKPFFKQDPDTLIGKTDADLWPAHLAEEIRANDRIVLSKGTTLNATESMSASGRIYDYLVSKFPIQRDGQTGIIAGIAIDLSHRIAAEKEKAELEARLQQAQRMEAIGTLAGGIAHDFNNILSAIIGYSEIALMDAGADGTVGKSLKNVLVAGERARDLVTQILTFSRQSDSEHKPLKLRFLVKEVLKLMRATLPSTIEIIDVTQSESNVMADATQMHQVIMNLCTNAAHAMRAQGGTLTLRLGDTRLGRDFVRMHPGTIPGRYLELTVEDTGHGIPADMIDRIFYPFFSTKEQGEGTGLGLSVVDGVIKKHGGAITVESHPERGSRFHVFLPIIDHQSMEYQTDANMPLRGTERILFVDDEPFQADLVARLLESLGYSVVSMTNSIEALELFRHDPYRFDLVITDMTMPHMTGDMLARELWVLRSGMPIILCTGYSEKIDKEHAFQLGFRDFAMKPIVIKDLAQILRQALDEGQPVTGDQVPESQT